ncbi:hypothetical protein DL915_20550 [Shigella sonnei]|nr:hypothetical protein [Shigella sonnei]
MGLKSAVKIRGESANYIGARSVTAAIKPDIKLQPTRHVKTMDALQTGCVHINTVIKMQPSGEHARQSCNQVNHLIPTRVLVKGGEITCKILK